MRAPELLPLLASLLCAAAFAQEAPSDSAAPAPAPIFALAKGTSSQPSRSSWSPQ